MKIRFALICTLLYLTSLVITLPASKLVQFILDDSGITLLAASGTIWQGSVRQLDYQNRYQLQQLHWNVNWLALTKLQLKLAIEFNNGRNALSGKGFLVWGMDGFSIEQLMIDADAAELLSYSDLVLPVEVGGELSLVIKKATQGLPYCQQFDGYMVWQNAQIESEMGNVNLASPAVELSCKNGLLYADLDQSSDQLTSQITLLLKERGMYQIQGVIQSGDKLDAKLKQALTWLGRTTSAGKTEINFNGRL